jgi:pyruvate formate lyase activating enzyme
MMVIAGVEPCSYVDWPGSVTAVAFTGGCNLSCYYCHNQPIIDPDLLSSHITPAEFLRWLRPRQGFLDGVVITGGEPTLHEDLPPFIDQIHGQGFGVKLDTNGTRPAALRALLESGRLNYVAMDIKAPRGKYEEVCCAPVDEAAVDESIRVIRDLAPDYEFRTTVLPDFSEEDIIAMASRISGAKRYILQQFRRPPHDGRIAPDIRNLHPPHTFREIQAMATTASGTVRACETRGLVAETIAGSAGLS